MAEKSTRARRKPATEEPTVSDSQKIEAAGKEASVPPSDPRDSVFDPAPGKSLSDVQERKAAHEKGEFQDAEEKPKPAQWYVVQEDDLTLIDVARKVGLHDHLLLTPINGIYNGRIEVRPGQKILLPESYTFTDIDNVETDAEAEKDDASV